MSKDDLIMVFYVDVREVHNLDVPEYIRNISMNLENGESINYFIPVHNDSKIDCINPKMIEGDEGERQLNKVKELSKEYQKVLHSYTK